MTTMPSNMDFKGKTFKNVMFTQNLENIEIINCNFENCVFKGVSFKNVLLLNCNFEACFFNFNQVYEVILFNSCFLDGTVNQIRGKSLRLIDCNFLNNSVAPGWIDDFKMFQTYFEPNCGGGYLTCFPEKGSFIAYKRMNNNIIAELTIPIDARRVNRPGSRFGQADKVIVNNFYDLYGNKLSITKENLNGLTYEKGKETYITGVSENRFKNENGINFLLTFHEAANDWSYINGIK